MQQPTDGCTWPSHHQSPEHPAVVSQASQCWSRDSFLNTRELWCQQCIYHQLVVQCLCQCVMLDLINVSFTTIKLNQIDIIFLWIKSKLSVILIKTFDVTFKVQVYQVPGGIVSHLKWRKMSAQQQTRTRKVLRKVKSRSLWQTMSQIPVSWIMVTRRGERRKRWTHGWPNTPSLSAGSALCYY